jgi:hypothetical protein
MPTGWNLAASAGAPLSNFLNTAAALDPDVQAGAWQRGQTWTVAAHLAEACSLDPNDIA